MRILSVHVFPLLRQSGNFKCSSYQLNSLALLFIVVLLFTGSLGRHPHCFDLFAPSGPWLVPSCLRNYFAFREQLSSYSPGESSKGQSLSIIRKFSNWNLQYSSNFKLLWSKCQKFLILVFQSGRNVDEPIRQHRQ